MEKKTSIDTEEELENFLNDNLYISITNILRLKFPEMNPKKLPVRGFCFLALKLDL